VAVLLDLERSNSELMLAVERLDGARAELVRGEKLAGLGSLVAGVAHELNTPIGNIAVVATTLSAHVNEFQQMVQAGTLKKSDLQRFLEICVEGVGMLVSTNQRAVDLVASFKQVAVDQTSERRRTFDLELTLSDLLRSIRPSFKGDDWHIESQVEADIALDSYPGPLGQVISNLVQNAIRHGFADRTEGTVKVLAHRLGNDQVEIQVQDDGAGISAQNLKKIFDPFFTTRLGQGGSGLGLTIVHNLVTSTLGGQVEVTSVEGVGTTFTLRLPLSAPNLQQATQA
ncbi:MAG: HAMP domain-containing sensor histidine kinase, partial [Rhodoferax sp.]|nr:HAMP domain-containing sensor histidine kinase [Rhodoferax sp.]